MALYSYKFIKNKKTYSDILVCDTITQARSILSEKNIFVESITPVTEFHSDSYLKNRELLDFFCDAASYLESGISISNALDMIAEDEGNLNFRTVILGISDQIKSGKSFQNAAEEFKLFPREALLFIKTGEKSNNLVDAFKQAGIYYNRKIETKRSLVSAITYPAFVFIVMCVALLFISFKVLPFLDTFFQKSGMALPAITQVIIFFSKILKKAWPLFLLIIFTAPYLVKMDSLKKVILNNLNRFKWFNSFYMDFKSADLIRLISAFMTSGMTLKQALFEAESMESDQNIKNRLTDVINDIDEGISFRKAIELRTLFTKRSIRILRAGEISGSLEKSMQRASSILESQNQASISNMMNLIEPALILFLSGCAGVIIVSVIIPLMTIKNTGL